MPEAGELIEVQDSEGRWHRATAEAGGLFATDAANGVSLNIGDDGYPWRSGWSTPPPKGVWLPLRVSLPPDVAAVFRDRVHDWVNAEQHGKLTAHQLKELPNRAKEAIVEAALRAYLGMD